MVKYRWECLWKFCCLWIREYHQRHVCLYLGLSAGTTSGNFTNFLDNYNFQIVDGAGTIVHGPYVVDETNQNVGEYATAIGPMELGNVSGYDVTRIEGGVEVYKFCPTMQVHIGLNFKTTLQGVI